MISKLFATFTFTLLSHIALSQNILFVGNSLTYSNDMPEILEELGKSLKYNITTKCICLPNYGLEDHLNQGLVEAELSRKIYDFVVFQQGPSSQEYGRKTLHQYGGQLTQLAKKNQTEPVYLMVWPSRNYYNTFNGVIKNHSDAAKANEALLAAVGIIWLRFNQQHPEFELYQSDDFHPSMLGSLLEALVILKTIQPNSNISELKGKVIDKAFKNKADAEKFLQILSDYLSEL